MPALCARSRFHHPPIPCPLTPPFSPFFRPCPPSRLSSFLISFLTFSFLLLCPPSAFFSSLSCPPFFFPYLVPTFSFLLSCSPSRLSFLLSRFRLSPSRRLRFLRRAFRSCCFSPYVPHICPFLTKCILHKFSHIRKSPRDLLGLCRGDFGSLEAAPTGVTGGCDGRV